MPTLGPLAGRNDTLTVGVINGLRRTRDHYGAFSFLSVERLCMCFGLPFSNALCLPSGWANWIRPPMLRRRPSGRLAVYFRDDPDTPC